MTGIIKVLRAYYDDTSGATAIEYGLIAALIGLGLVAGLRLMGGGTTGMWTKISNKVDAEL
jgi:pilus assembly protein Flp/PilA